MPRKLKFDVRKTRADVTHRDLTSSTVSTSAVQTDISIPADYEIVDQETQTDSAELSSSYAQTDVVEFVCSCCTN